MKRLKIVITLPHGIDKCDTIAWQCIQRLPEWIGEYEIASLASYGATIANVRNFAVNETGCSDGWQNNFNFDKLLFVDYDIGFTETNVRQLLDCGNVIAGGLYLRSDGNRYEAGYNDKVKGLAENKIEKGQEGAGLVSVDYVGAGFLMIDEVVFRRLPYPWFRHDLIEWEDEKKVWHGVSGTDDIGFCALANKHGFPVFAHTDCILTHNKGATMTGIPKQQLTEAAIETNVNRACTQIMASVQMLVDKLRQMDAALKALQDAQEKKEPTA